MPWSLTIEGCMFLAIRRRRSLRARLATICTWTGPWSLMPSSGCLALPTFDSVSFSTGLDSV